jgi:hypothetical protein
MPLPALPSHAFGRAGLHGVSQDGRPAEGYLSVQAVDRVMETDSGSRAGIAGLPTGKRFLKQRGAD